MGLLKHVLTSAIGYTLKDGDKTKTVFCVDQEEAVCKETRVFCDLAELLHNCR